ncbi:protein Smaug homolog 1-like [Anneissia japonica]|uniref:protein Smaug homolog 1-like n=1 Tax=Anneissia japonica TaxID=1529436 RepID=UPI0014257726|nr:protein Smaug homolog 1-like [Anneissia japonica]XP_033106635.1 protein Smaug homolog 1-like [Anneissia japonica]XP_033106636.1 protein Smaug homolog 1-like [Anneissia japonica]XP_033106637.1 protein Smaug homolog 1-like [Anneissia japonica]
MPTNGKPTFLFRDQVNAVSNVFKEWNHCEQTVALYSLLKRITSTQTRFLTLVLEQSNCESDGFKQLEQEANDRGFVASLLSKSKETAIEQLLSHLPLLQPGSVDAKKQYLSIIPKILAHSLEGSIHLDECRQLLSYLLIHPALTNDERGSLTYWLGRLDEHANGHGVYPPRVSPEGSPSSSPYTRTHTTNGHYTEPNYVPGSKINGWRDSGIGETPSGTLNNYSSSAGSHLSHPPLTYTVSAPPAVNSHASGPSTSCILTAGCTTTLNLPQKNNRNSLTPPESMVQSSLSTQDWYSHEDLETRGSRSLHLPSQCNEHAPLSPQSSTASSGSSTEAQNEETSSQPSQKSSFREEGSGMKDVPSWLKTLRLHKYSYLFQQLTYQEMLDLTEEQLEAMNVTKGARHKIVLSIQKLKERQSTLQNLEKDIMSDSNAGTLRNALNEIKTMLGTPIRSQQLESDSYDQYSQDQPASPSDNDQGMSHTVAKGDLPGQITRFMGKMCTQLVMSRRPDEDAISLYLQLLDKCLNHEAFSNTHKKRLMSWRQSCQKFSSRSPYMRKQSMQDLRGPRTWGHISNIPIEYKPGLRRQRLCFPQHLNQRVPVVIGMGSSGLFRPASNHASNLNYSAQQLSGNHHQGVQRTQSMPVQRRMSQPVVTVQQGLQTTDSATTLQEPDINNCLENLCRSVTEIALSDGSEHNLDSVGN